MTNPPLQNIYIGTFAGGGSKGIYLAHFNPATGSLTKPELTVAASSPSFMAFHPNGRFLYAVVEGGPSGAKPGAAAFAIDPQSGALSLLNQQPGGGTGPCHLSVDAGGKNLLLANYNSGSAAVLPIGEDGRLKEAACVIQHQGHGTDPKRQEGPHAHEIVLDPAQRFAFVPDLGLDKVYAYRFDAKAGLLTENDPPAADLAPGSGPRQITFDRSAKFAYVLCEMAATVTSFAYDANRGSLRSLQTLSLLPDGYKGFRGAAQLTIHPNGKFVYASNRGHDSIATFSRDADTGLLKYIDDTMTGGKTPRHFAIDPAGLFLIAANQDSNTLTIFSIDPTTGKLKDTGASIEAPKPTCVLFPEPTQ